jgi:hypothetical protein
MEQPGEILGRVRGSHALKIGREHLKRHASGRYCIEPDRLD